MQDMRLIRDIAERGIVNIIPSKESFIKLLQTDKKLNIYLGIDPTATRIHIGHAVPLRKLGKFVELGHNVTFLIGDFTALIGDTSDKESERPILTKEEIVENFKSYKSQAEKIIDFSKIKVVHNSKWLGKLSFEDIVKIAQNFSVGDFVGRDLIRRRLAEGKRVRLDETLYPVMQGYDSYYMDTDIQIGAADQTFNMQAGRTLQKNLRGKESFVLVNDYLMGTDGNKMSKSLGNAIWIEDDPFDMFGKLMSVEDSLIGSYLEFGTDLPLEEVKKLKEKVKTNPYDTKLELAKRIVFEIHGADKSRNALIKFKKTFSERSPDFSETVERSTNILELVSKKVGSKSEAKRLIASGAIKVNSNVSLDPTLAIKGGENVTIGKKIFVKVK